MIWRIGDDRVRRRVLAAAILGVVLVLHLWSLPRFPGPFVDEAWFGNRAWSFVQHGNPLGTLDHGVVDRFDGSSHFFQTLPPEIALEYVRRSPRSGAGRYRYPPSHS